MVSILIVDDAAFSRRMIRKYLQVDGYEIWEATNGSEALKIVRDRVPDCVVTDLLMPDMNGFELLQALKEQGFAIPTIVISADIQDSSRQRGYDLGAAAFINKPPKEDELRQTVRQFFSF